jgi:dolichol-phosphate mannosyltransferase
MSARRVLITGAAGFVGASLARRLLRDGHDLHLVVRAGTDSWRLAAAGIEGQVHRADLTDASAVQEIVAAARPDWVFHLAAYGNSSWHADHQRMVATNVAATIALLDACVAQGFDAFVHGGSSSEYGFKDHLVSETERPDPNSPYAVTKLAATNYCAYVARTRDLRIITLRLYSLYGPLEDPARLVPVLIAHGLRGGYPPLADPASGHDFVYVDDAIDAFVRAAGEESCRGGEIFNVATGRTVPLAEIVGVTRAVLRIPGEPVWASYPARSWDAPVWAGDISRIRARLAWEPRHSLDEGIRAFVNWLERTPAVRQRYRLEL